MVECSKSRWSRIPICAALALLVVAPVIVIDGTRAQHLWDYALVWIIIFCVFAIFALLLD